MPWVYVLVLIGGAYFLVKLLQGLRELVVWYREGRAFAEEQRRAHERHRQAAHDKRLVPTLKERPEPTVAKPKTNELKKSK